MSNINKHPLYPTFNNMMQRCYNKNSHNHDRYGGRGIYVQKSWHANGRGFIEYVETTLGEKPSPYHTLDRIDNNKGYEEGNLRWATMREQQNNRSSNRTLTVDGVTLTIAQWSRKMGINNRTLIDRVKRNWSDEDAVLTPVGAR